MKILLVYPEMYDSFYAFRHVASLIGKKAAFPPLGLLTVAAMLPQNWERRLIDLNVKPLSDSDIEWADLVFLSAMNVQEESVRQIIGQCKKKMPLLLPAARFLHTSMSALTVSIILF